MRDRVPSSFLRVLWLVWSLGIHRSFFICIIKEKKRGEKDYLSISITHIDSMVFAYLVKIYHCGFRGRMFNLFFHIVYVLFVVQITPVEFTRFFNQIDVVFLLWLISSRSFRILFYHFFCKCPYTYCACYIRMNQIASIKQVLKLLLNYTMRTP